ncbi:MAG: tannase/feruloyl esterase family alpha/beta hydrolase [Bacteroidales bacterium]
MRITEASEVEGESLHCRVLGIIGKEINFELLLPADWNALFIMGGGGGFVGTIQNAARPAVSSGYATSGTDTGHDSRNSLSADWALNNMERQLNFGHLAIHRTAEVSKAIIGNYYGYYPKYSYFIGCSRGGGQAMMEAQRYPDDFDGIVAGAPAFNWPAIAAEFIQNTQALYPVEFKEPLITRDHLRMLHDAIVSQCDLIDGVNDGILSNPADCNFDFTSLPECPGNVTGIGCFTAIQLDAIRKIYEGVDIGNGVTYPGFPFGGEKIANGWDVWITGSEEIARQNIYPSLHAYFGIEIFKYLVLQDPEWDYRTYDFSGYEKEISSASAYLDATSTDYNGFKKRNGKLILWHGWNDPALSAYATIEHYNEVKAIDPDIMDYMRLFLLPGVLHCGGGDGPSQVDWIAIIRDWVENDNPPDRITASKTVPGENVITRPLFPYPGQARYNGKGDPHQESSYIKK